MSGKVGRKFGEPAWDILLDLYCAQDDKKPVSVSSASHASAGPPTTALRYLTSLERGGLIVREHDSRDRRRWFVRITTIGMTMMDHWLSRITTEAQPAPPAVLCDHRH